MKAALINAALVGSGGFAGTPFRFGLNGLVQRRVALATFPYGALAVNLLGCLLIGLLGGLMESRQLLSSELRKLALIGFLGGFTTYSTFSYETFLMIREAEHLRAAANIGAHVVFGLALVWAGYSLTISR